jgi:hypothetical protein
VEACDGSNGIDGVSTRLELTQHEREVGMPHTRLVDGVLAALKGEQEAVAA